MSLSRGLSKDTQVGGTTLTHQSYKYKTQSGTFTDGDKPSMSSSWVGESRTLMKMSSYCNANFVFHQISIWEILSKSQDSSFHSFCEAHRSTSLKFPFRPQRWLAKLSLHYPEAFLSFGLSGRYSLEMTSRIRSKEGEEFKCHISLAWPY